MRSAELGMKGVCEPWIREGHSMLCPRLGPPWIGRVGCPQADVC